MAHVQSRKLKTAQTHHLARSERLVLIGHRSLFNKTCLFTAPTLAGLLVIRLSEGSAVAVYTGVADINPPAA